MSPSELRLWFCLNFDRQNRRESSENHISYISRICNITYLDCTIKVIAFLIGIIGLLTSLWANCSLIVLCTENYEMYESKELFIEKTIINTCRTSHFIIVTTCTAGLLYGVQIKNKTYFIPWILIKIIEISILLFATIFLSIWGNRKYVPIIPFTISFFFMGLYITSCVWKTYKNDNMEDTPSSSLENIRTQLPILRDPPPSYDSYLIQNI